MDVRLTGTEREVLEALISHNALCEEVSLSDLAEECHVAKSTVVKTLQKLGYEGFQDYVYSHQATSSIHSARVLPRHVVEGSFSQAVEDLAACIARCRGKGNVAYAGGEPGASLAAYVSRKLNMFGLPVCPSYDAVLFKALSPNAGVMFLFLRPPVHAVQMRDEVRTAYEGLLERVKRLGFYTVAFVDAFFDEGVTSVDTLIKIAGDRSTAMNMYPVKVLMLFEAALGCYAERWQAERSQERVGMAPGALDSLAPSGRVLREARVSTMRGVTDGTEGRHG